MRSNAEFRIQNSGSEWFRLLLCLNLAFCILNYPTAAHAQIGRTVAAVVVEQEGRPLTDPLVLGLIETRVGFPLDAKDVRETITHIMSLNRFDDVQVWSEDAETGIQVRYVLTPLHPVDRDRAIQAAHSATSHRQRPAAWEPQRRPNNTPPRGGPRPLKQVTNDFGPGAQR